VPPLASPDVPGYVSYLVVLIVGIFVGVSRVNRLMATSPGRWRFLQTWFLFLAYVVVPLLLFWFLDFTNALHDTSLVAALLVALGYRQILVGEMKGIPAPGPASSLWSPLESWAGQVRERIVTKSKLYSDRFNEKVRSNLAKDPDSLQALLELAYQTVGNRTQLDQDLATLAQEVKPAELTADAFARTKALKTVEIAMRALRITNPEDYGFLLVRRKLITRWQYGWWLGDLRARLTQWFGFVAIGGLLIWGLLYFFQFENLLRYHQWRFVKASATDADRYRTQKKIAGCLVGSTNETATAAVIYPITHWLRYPAVDRRLAEDILHLVVEYHDPARNRVTIPELIRCLQTENPDIRLRIHETLLVLQRLDYPKVLVDSSLTNWVPSKSESSGTVEENRGKHNRWWTLARSP
jgi:hypothetical protein